jgi:hypothetical protein
MPHIPKYMLTALRNLVEDERWSDVNAEKCRQWAMEISEVLVSDVLGGVEA